MRRFLVMLLALVVLLIVVSALAVKFFGWWGVAVLVALAAGVAWLVYQYAGRALTWALTQPFRLKGAVLRGATVTVHGIEPAPAPAAEPGCAADEPETDDLDEEGETDDLGEPGRRAGLSDGPRGWYHLDVTVTPRAEVLGGDPDAAGFRHWEPGELRLAGPDARGGLDDDGDDGLCEVAGVQVWQGGAFQPDEGGKYFGPQRLRLHIGVAPAAAALRFMYYLEVFGDVALPGRAGRREAQL